MCIIACLPDGAFEIVRLAQECRLEVHERQAGIGTGERRVPIDSLAEELRRERIVASVEAVYVLQAEMIRGPCIEVVR